MNLDHLYRTSIDAFSAGDLAAGQRACDHLLAQPTLDSAWRSRTLLNQVFYARPLTELLPGTTITRLPIPWTDLWGGFNPSIAADGDGYRCILRGAGYTMIDGRYTVFDPDGIVRTRNWLLTLDAGLQVTAAREIEDRTGAGPVGEFPVRGFEDCRLFQAGGRWYATATVRDQNPAGTCQVALLTLEDGAFTSMTLLTEPKDGHQKNWMPVAGQERLLLVDRCSPTTVWQVDPVSGAKSLVANHGTVPIATDFRGGSQLIPDGAGWLAVIHEATVRESGQRVYLHRLVRFDHDFRLVAVTPDFTFVGPAIEFCAGLAPAGDDLVLTFGMADREPFLVRVNREAFTALLVPVADLAVVPPLPPREDVAGFSPFPLPETPWLVAVTLADNREGVIRGALESVRDWVDAVVLVDTGITDGTQEIAREIMGERLLVVPLPWPENFASARNASLRFAESTGATWAMILDTDERIETQGEDVRALLAASEVDLLRVQAIDGTYAKDRFFRLPVRGRYTGATHEAFIVAGERVEILPGMRFREEAKSPDDLKRKLLRDVRLLRREIEENPADGRWHYYLGDALQNLGSLAEAVEAFERCAQVTTWPTEAAWSCYRAAACLDQLGEYDRGIKLCARGLGYHAGVTELAWLAGYLSFRAARYEQAIWWSNLAIANGRYAGQPQPPDRDGFQHPPALWEGPYDVLRATWRAQDREAERQEAERHFQAAYAARQAAQRR